MKDILHKFLSILQIELEDLEDDIEVLVELCQKRMNSGEITPYVYLENKGLLLNEIAGVKEVLKNLSSMDTRRYGSVREMMEEIERTIRTRIHEGVFPEAVYNLVERRVKKVTGYVLGSAE